MSAPHWPTVGGTIHIAAPYVEVGQQLRQRCLWCGTLILDYDLTRIAVPEGEDPRPPTWEAGVLVEVNDGMQMMLVPHKDGDLLPPNACAHADLNVPV